MITIWCYFFWLYSRYILYLSFYKCVYNIVYTTFSFYSRALGTTAENVNVFWVVLILRPNIIFVVHVPYARRHSPTNIHDYFFFPVRSWKIFWFALWTFLIEKFASDLYFLRKIEKSTPKLGPKLIPSALFKIYRYMQINIAKLLYINILVEVHEIHWTE